MKASRPTTKRFRKKQPGPERFGDFVRRIRAEKKLSLADVSKRSGKQITGGYICRIENDPTRHVTAEKLRALACGLGIPVEELLVRAAGLMRDQNADELSLLARFRRLSPERKADVLRIIELWHSGNSTSAPRDAHRRRRKLS